MASEFDLDQYLRDNGLELQGLDPESSMPIVKDKVGNVHKFDTQSLIKDLGGNPDEIENIVYNRASTSLQQSPVSPEERAKLAFGNVEGNLTYLSKKFDEAAYHPDHGISVKKDGLWYAVDPSLLGKGDAWDKTKALVKHGFGLLDNPDLKGDLAELGPEAINAVSTGVGGVLGAAAGIGAAAATMGAAAPLIPYAEAAGVAAGGAVSGGIRTLMGKALGTYEASPDQIVEDIGMESLMSLGGHALAAGVKPTLGAIVNASKNISRSATELTKDSIANVVGGMTKAGNVATRTLLDHSGEVGATITRAAKAAGGNVNKAIDHVVQLKNQAVENLLTTANEALPNKYGELLDTLLEKAGKVDFKVNMRGVVENTFDTLEQLGLGRKIEKSTLSDKMIEAEARITGKTFDEIASAADKNLGFKFFSTKQFVEKVAGGADAELLSAEERASLNPLIKVIQQFGNVGELKGKAAAKVLKNFEKNLNQLSQRAFESDNEAYKRLVGKISGAFRNNVTREFEEQGLGAEYGALSQLYGEFGDAVNMSRRILRSDKGLETLTNQLSSAPGKGATSKGLRDTLVNLLGQQGEDQVKNISILNSAEKFLPRAPQWGLFQMLGVGGVALGNNMMDLGTKAMVLGGGALASSPRFMGRALQVGATPIEQTITYGLKATDWLKQRTPQELKLLLGNDQAFQSFMRPVMTAPMMESQMREGLIQSGSQGTQALNDYAHSVMMSVRQNQQLPSDLQENIEGMASSVGSLQSLGSINRLTSKLKDQGKGVLAKEAKMLFQEAKAAHYDYLKAQKGNDLNLQKEAASKFSEARQKLNKFKDFVDSYSTKKE